MKTQIEVKDREEAAQLKLGLSDPSVRAFVRIMGTLSTLKSQRTKERALTFVKDHFEEMERHILDEWAAVPALRLHVHP